jgi:peroxiredoxin
MTDLATELNAFMDGLLVRADPATAQLFATTQGRQAVAEPHAGAIDVGDRAPDFSLPDQHGAQVSLSETLARGPVVLLFVRGGWCPFCALTLRAYDRLRPALQHAGATLLAVSPQTQANSLATAERDALGYSLLSDHGLQVADAYGLVWQPDTAMQAVLQRLGHDLPRINGSNDWRLPIPAGYVIDRNGVVRTARHVPNIADRLPPVQALDAVLALGARTGTV